MLAHPVSGPTLRVPASDDLSAPEGRWRFPRESAQDGDPVLTMKTKNDTKPMEEMPSIRLDARGDKPSPRTRPQRSPASRSSGAGACREDPHAYNGTPTPHPSAAAVLGTYGPRGLA